MHHFITLRVVPDDSKGTTTVSLSFSQHFRITIAPYLQISNFHGSSLLDLLRDHMDGSIETMMNRILDCVLLTHFEDDDSDCDALHLSKLFIDDAVLECVMDHLEELDIQSEESEHVPPTADYRELPSDVVLVILDYIEQEITSIEQAMNDLTGRFSNSAEGYQLLFRSILIRNYDHHSGECSALLWWIMRQVKHISVERRFNTLEFPSMMEQILAHASRLTIPDLCTIDIRDYCCMCDDESMAWCLENGKAHINAHVRKMTFFGHNEINPQIRRVVKSFPNLRYIDSSAVLESDVLDYIAENGNVNGITGAIADRSGIEQCLKKCTSVTDLNISSPSSSTGETMQLDWFKSLKEMNHVKRLSIRPNKFSIQTWQSTPICHSLTSLILEGIELHSLDGINTMPRLQRLSVSIVDYASVTLSELHPCKDLRELTLRGNGICSREFRQNLSDLVHDGKIQMLSLAFGVPGTNYKDHIERQRQSSSGDSVVFPHWLDDDTIALARPSRKSQLHTLRIVGPDTSITAMSLIPILANIRLRNAIFSHMAVSLEVQQRILESGYLDAFVPLSESTGLTTDWDDIGDNDERTRMNLDYTL